MDRPFHPNLRLSPHEHFYSSRLPIDHIPIGLSEQVYGIEQSREVKTTPRRAKEFSGKSTAEFLNRYRAPEPKWDFSRANVRASTLSTASSFADVFFRGPIGGVARRSTVSLAEVSAEQEPVIVSETRE
jgi:hypothetical protein